MDLKIDQGVNERKKVEEAQVFDPYFGIRVSNPKVSLSTVDTFCSVMRKMRLCDLSPKVEPNGEWMTMGVVVEKSECRKSGNGNEWMVWRMSDLSTFGGATAKVLLFGDCVQQYWKFQVGMTVLLNSPKWAESTPQNEKEVVLKVFKAAQVIEIGFCPDFSVCQAQKANGEPCRNAVNVRQSLLCPFHVQQRGRQLAANRGALNRSYNLPPKQYRSLDEPTGSISSAPPPGGLKTVRRVADGRIYTKLKTPVPRGLNQTMCGSELKEKKKQAELQKIVAENPHTLGARHLLVKHNRENEDPKGAAVAPSPSLSQRSTQSMRDFIQSQPLKKALSSSPSTSSLVVDLSDPHQQLPPPKLSGLRKTELLEQMKIKRAAQILKSGTKRRKPGPDEESRQADCSDDAKRRNGGPLLGGSFSDEQIRALLGKKSKHDDEARQEELKRQNEYFDHKQVDEHIETSATNLMELKGCKVVTCTKCNYTSAHQSAHCKSLGHEVKRHSADKRFFKCRVCQQRTTAYDRMPSKPCLGCKSKDFYRVAMRDERKVLTEREQLKIKEEERNFSALK